METEASTSTDDELRLPAPPAPPTNTGTNRNRYSDESKKSSGLKGTKTGKEWRFNEVCYVVLLN